MGSTAEDALTNAFRSILYVFQVTLFCILYYDMMMLNNRLYAFVETEPYRASIWTEAAFAHVLAAVCYTRQCWKDYTAEFRFTSISID